ncbi:MAG: glucosyltransferase domain-containing protein [Waltera sp.]
MGFFQSSRTKIKNTWKIAFLSAFVLGILIHLPVMLSDIPNHDGLSSMYFDQNMITSGRWFLSVACGFSSYFTIPWIIGLIGLLWLALAAVALTELLELADPLVIMAVSGLLVSFPALASTFAYVFTMDGYMMALFLAILAVLFTKKQKKGWLAGAVCLAFSMGIYQAYLPFAILLCVYVILLFFMEEKGWKTKAFYVLRYLGMGVAGAALYYVILQILLKLQGKVLDTYQGINSMEQGGSGLGLFATIRGMYVDFLAFTVHGNVLGEQYFLFYGLCGTGASGGLSAGEKHAAKKMVEESGIFRYNNYVGGGTSAFDQCDSGDFSESDLSFADAVSVGIISDPDAGICGQICVGGRENRYRDPVGGITGGRNPGIQLWSIG